MKTIVTTATTAAQIWEEVERVNVEARKEELFRVFDEIESDIKTLSLWIMKAREELELVRTEKDAKIYDQRHGDIEEKLIHIRLF